MNKFWKYFKDVILDAKWALAFAFGFLIIGLALKDENTPYLLGTFAVMFMATLIFAVVDSFKKLNK